jgi:hypothetical protein
MTASFSDTVAICPMVLLTPLANFLPVLLTPLANLPLVRRRKDVAEGFNDTCGKFAAGVNDTGGAHCVANIFAILKKLHSANRNIGGPWKEDS